MKHSMIVTVIAAGASLAVLTGCSSAPTAEEAAARESLVASVMAEIEADENAWVPAGYEVVTPGVGVRWASDYGTDFECPSYAASCFGVELVTNTACPSGVYIELALVDETGTIRGMANEISPALAPGDHAVIVVSSTESSPRARLAQVNCM